ncbi:hypothetical protein M0P98_00765 [bacterium]|nr:hypothetical protein [bacterium]
MKNIFKFVLTVIILSVTMCSAERINILTPYFGVEKNTFVYKKYNVSLEDSSNMKGIFFQSVDTKKYQYNLYLFLTENINYSDLKGINFVYDHYFTSNSKNKNVLGAGVNFLNLNLDGKNVPVTMGTLDGFKLDMDVYSLFFRAGRSYATEGKKLNLTMMPWAGVQMDKIRGNGFVDYPGPGEAFFDVVQDEYYGIVGIKLMADYCHFIQGELKYNITFNDEYYHKVAAMLNLFFSRSLGLSYRFSYQETSVGKDVYNIFGVAVMF